MHPSLIDAAPKVFWTDRHDAPAEHPPLVGDVVADVCVVGGGYTGLWAAFEARRRFPDKSVVLVEAGRVGGEASSRNGGFCSASLTHGLANGVERFPSEIDVLLAEGLANHAAIATTVADEAIECDWRASGTLDVAQHEWLVGPLREHYELAVQHGVDVEWLDTDEVRSRVNSPTFHAGVLTRRGESIVDPARLAWALGRLVAERGVTVYERTAMVGLERRGPGMLVRCATGAVRAHRVVLATNAFRSPVRRINRTVVPVYDHVLATEPLDETQRRSIGWDGFEGVGDSTNLFHYSRRTADNRIVWGGYDATYHWGSGIDRRHEQQDSTHDLLAQHFFDTFPQLEGLRFSHRWGGVIDTCTRFAVAFGTSFDGRVADAVGYTGLGVGASRWGALVALDLLFDPESPRASLEFVRRRPLPFPPEPFKWVGINLTRRALESADRHEGRRGAWLRTLDAVGLGFDS